MGDSTHAINARNTSPPRHYIFLDSNSYALAQGIQSIRFRWTTLRGKHCIEHLTPAVNRHYDSLGKKSPYVRVGAVQQKVVIIVVSITGGLGHVR